MQKRTRLGDDRAGDAGEAAAAAGADEDDTGRGAGTGASVGDPGAEVARDGSGTVLTRGELRDRSNRIANGLHAIGLRRGIIQL